MRFIDVRDSNCSDLRNSHGCREYIAVGTIIQSTFFNHPRLIAFRRLNETTSTNAIKSPNMSDIAILLIIDNN